MTIEIDAEFTPNDKDGNDRAPDFRIYSRSIEIGAAWRIVDKNLEPTGRFNVELDDPGFFEPVRATLWPAESKSDAVLIWSRR